MHASNKPIIENPTDNHNDVFISDAKTESGSKHSPSDNDNDNNDADVDAQLDNNKELDNDVDIGPAENLDDPHPKNKRYEVKDFIARKYGRDREPWVQKHTPFPRKPSKNTDEGVNTLLK